MRRPTSKDVNLLVYLEVFTVASTVVIIAIIAVVALLFTCLACFVKHDRLFADPDREEFNLLSGLSLAARILGQLGYPIGEDSTVQLNFDVGLGLTWEMFLSIHKTHHS